MLNLGFFLRFFV